MNTIKPRAAMRVTGGLKRGVRSASGAIFLILFLGFFAMFASAMGLANAISTMMNTAYDLLLSTVLYIMALAVLAGAVSALFAEFKVLELLNKLLSPLMRPLFGMPGAAALGIMTTYLSDNPAVLSLADDKRYRRYFKDYQIPALTNLGTSFGMGLIITAFMLGLGRGVGENLGIAVLAGNLGAVCGGVLSTRLMLRHTARVYGKAQSLVFQHKEAPCGLEAAAEGRPIGLRFIDSMLEGGKSGVKMGLDIIPGVLIICTLVMMLTNGPGAGGAYTGGAYEGIGLLPRLADRIDFILKPLFGFTHTAGIAVPITALGAAGAAIGLVPQLVANGQAAAGDIAVFTAMCMCWSGFLSTHVSMMNALHANRFLGKAILYHTLGGLLAGVAAHWLYLLLCLLP